VLVAWCRLPFRPTRSPAMAEESDPTGLSRFSTTSPPSFISLFFPLKKLLFSFLASESKTLIQSDLRNTHTHTHTHTHEGRPEDLKLNSRNQFHSQSKAGHETFMVPSDDPLNMSTGFGRLMENLEKSWVFPGLEKSLKILKSQNSCIQQESTIQNVCEPCVDTSLHGKRRGLNLSRVDPRCLKRCRNTNNKDSVCVCVCVCVNTQAGPHGV